MVPKLAELCQRVLQNKPNLEGQNESEQSQYNEWQQQILRQAGREWEEICSIAGHYPSLSFPMVMTVANSMERPRVLR